MRLRRRHTSSGPDPETCEHAWRLRDVTVALPGAYVCEVCDRCGTLRLHGPDAITGPASGVADGAAIHLESLERRAPSHHESPPSADGPGRAGT